MPTTFGIAEYHPNNLKGNGIKELHLPGFNGQIETQVLDQLPGVIRCRADMPQGGNMGRRGRYVG